MPNAMVLIKPTSVTISGTSTATISNRGSITYSNITSTQKLSLNGIFTSSYRNYIVYHQSVASGSGATTYENIQLRSSGSDAIGGNYNNQWFGYTSSQVSGRASGATRFYGMEISAGRIGEIYYFFGPQLADQTSYIQYGTSERGTISHYNQMAIHTLGNSYDGFTLYPDGVNCTLDGKIAIYGFNE